MKMSTGLLASLFCLPLCVSTALAAVTIEGTRVIHDAAHGSDVTIKTRNNGERPALVQVWIDDGQGDMRPEDIRVPFRMTPVEPRLIQPQQGQAYRVTFAPRPGDPAIATDRESVYYFNLLDIPPKPIVAQGSNLLQFAVRTRIKLFYRPAELPGKPTDAGPALRWTATNAGAPHLHIHNPSPYHVSLVRIALADGSELPADMVAPFGSLDVRLPATVQPPSTLTYAWLDDYGAQREKRAEVELTVDSGAMPPTRP